MSVLDGLKHVREEGRLSFTSAGRHKNRVVPTVLDDIERPRPSWIVLGLGSGLVKADQRRQHALARLHLDEALPARRCRGIADLIQVDPDRPLNVHHPPRDVAAGSAIVLRSP